MRELTFDGFLRRYVRSLSYSDTCSLSALVKEAERENPRLKEPLFLYALFCGKQKLLGDYAKESALKDEYTAFFGNMTAEKVLNLFSESSPLLEREYHKVWRSYQSEKNKRDGDNYTKKLMRDKVLCLQKCGGITNYRIYTDLGLNPGNLNFWLKHGDPDKVSLDTARRTLRYLETKVNDLQADVSNNVQR